MPLTPQQVDAVEVLDWLLDIENHRREGRSVACAVALIRLALRYPGRHIEFRDFSPMSSRDQHMFIGGTIERFIQDDLYLRQLPWQIGNRDFAFVPPRIRRGDQLVLPSVPQDWWPDGDSLGHGLFTVQVERRPLPLTSEADRHNAESIRAAEDDRILDALERITEGTLSTRPVLPLPPAVDRILDDIAADRLAAPPTEPSTVDPVPLPTVAPSQKLRGAIARLHEVLAEREAKKATPITCWDHILNDEDD